MGGAGWGACSDGQTVNTRLPGDVRLYPRVCPHERCAICDRFSPAVKTSVLRAPSSILQMAKLSGYICDRLAVPIPALGASGRLHSISLMSARVFVAVVLAWGIESAARVIRAGRGGRLQGVGSALFMRIAPFRLPRPARPESAPAGPKARGRQEGADQPWRRDGR